MPVPTGQLEAGNIDLGHRPRVKNKDGSISTVRSLGVNVDGNEVLIPTVRQNPFRPSTGWVMPDQQAVDYYRKTGQHLGIFDTPDNSDAYAQQLHKDQSKMYLPESKKRGGAVTKALSLARRAKAYGGEVSPHMKRGGGIKVPHFKAVGMIKSAVPGRTDKHPMNVKTGSFVVPADTVSSLGEGNSEAGADSLGKLLKMGPYGSDAAHFADGGDVQEVPIVAAGGEFIIPPEKVAEIGGGDMEHGHDVLDAFVKHVRSKTIKTLKSLPGPKKD